MRLVAILIVMLSPTSLNGEDWGFFAHRKINRLAVFTLPPEMIGFYKQNIRYITEKVVIPDKRSYVVKEEAARHYIDLDVYGDSAVYKMPRYWKDAVKMYSEDTLKAYGIVPYHISRVSYWLIEAFKNKDTDRILKLSTEIGHYIADINVPLHTTKNYNGQLTGQYGIHGLWESRLPELFADTYDLLTGKAEYITDLQLYAWEAVTKAHEAVDSVLIYEHQLIKKYSYEERSQSTTKSYSYNFSSDYHKKLDGMVERRMQASIKMIGDFWFSCWVKSGQPDLSKLANSALESQDNVLRKNAPRDIRNHENRTEDHQ